MAPPIADLRQDYRFADLTEVEAGPEPVALFLRWFQAALDAELPEPNAFTLATATPDGRSSARVVLMKGCDERGWVFYSNFHSRKSRELIANPWAALAFHWHAHERQVRVEGRAERVPDAEADAYYASRPRGSRLGAWASPQSEVIAGREIMDRRWDALQAEYPEGAEVPRPPFWGGWRVVPEAVEFWQGGPNRLHDRIRFRREGQTWIKERLGA